jgi:hypothetical protein
MEICRKMGQVEEASEWKRQIEEGKKNIYEE